jgi:ankyrin repeat protein
VEPIDSEDDEGKTILVRAIKATSGNDDMVRVIKEILDKGADIHKKDSKKNTPMHIAAQ